ncbi:uncharacterized protein BDW43DRAFT_286085 [Aspergillus alliaceus]|uniref:uncharacterized protein n=1 Tax=Petromyces alliaceus TaxID=209559 RepID=UPI0012A43DBB|nr:uncharacterized protein BDW43DRAFT_286085 [Aspergillus alliaceus]KAB8230312.1 hypothetical protein BDW43DRAFT_286085 [Aspergillus alliaceus]
MYRCGNFPDPHGAKVMNTVSSIQDCAEFCAKDTGCAAGVWDYRGHGTCYTTTEIKAMEPDQFMVLLEKNESNCQDDGRYS